MHKVTRFAFRLFPVVVALGAGAVLTLAMPAVAR